MGSRPNGCLRRRGPRHANRRRGSNATLPKRDRWTRRQRVGRRYGGGAQDRRAKNPGSCSGLRSHWNGRRCRRADARKCDDSTRARWFDGARDRRIAAKRHMGSLLVRAPNSVPEMASRSRISLAGTMSAPMASTMCCAPRAAYRGSPPSVASGSPRRSSRLRDADVVAIP